MEPVYFVIHPDWLADATILGYCRQLQRAGVRVLVMPVVGGPAVPMSDWLRR